MASTSLALSPGMSFFLAARSPILRASAILLRATGWHATGWRYPVSPPDSGRCDLSLNFFLPLCADLHHTHTRVSHRVVHLDAWAFLLQQRQPFSPRFVQRLIVPFYSLESCGHSPPERVLRTVLHFLARKIAGSLVFVFKGLFRTSVQCSFIVADLLMRLPLQLSSALLQTGYKVLCPSFC